MNNISLVFSKQPQQQQVQKYLLSTLMQNRIDFCVFADRTLNLNNTNMCLFPTGNLLSYTGDVICVTPEDVAMVKTLRRDINIKYIIDTVYNEIQDWFDDEQDIEYLTVVEDDKILNLVHSITGINKIKTLNEYIS